MGGVGWGVQGRCKKTNNSKNKTKKLLEKKMGKSLCFECFHRSVFMLCVCATEEGA